MIEDIPKGYNIGWTVVDDRCVTTASVARSSPVGYHLQFETFIWFWDGEKRTSIIDQIIHRSKNEAEKVHGYIVSNLETKKVSE